MRLLSKYIFLYSILLLCSVRAYTQNHWIDSVKKSLSTQQADTNKVRSLIDLSGDLLFYSPDSSFAYAQKALNLAEKLHYDGGVFWAIVFINKSLFTLGNYVLELEYAFKAYPLGYKLNYVYTIGWANGMMGDAYFNLGEYVTALKYYRKVVATAERAAIIDLPSIYCALTTVFIKLNHFDSALFYAKKGFELSKQYPALNKDDADSKYNKSILYRFLGDAFSSTGNYDSALYYYRVSLPFSEQVHMEMDRIDAFNGIANIYKLQGKLDSATFYAKKALSADLAKKYPSSLLNAANTLADIYTAQKIPDSTLKYLRMAISVKDSLFNRDKAVAVQNILFREQEKQNDIEAAKATLQNRFILYFTLACFIALLIIAGIIVGNKRKRQLQKIRNSIADDLHDDIGSALSSISIMNELAKASSPEALPLLTSIGENTIAIQENMSDIIWAVNAQNDRFENISQRMNQFASEILDTKNTTLHFTCDASLAAIKLTMEQRKNFYLFFKEVINNAAKYADAKQVAVCITKKDNNIEMKIEDDGKGFDTSATYNGNGMRTLKKRAAELAAGFTIAPGADNGTAVWLKFKIS